MEETPQVVGAPARGGRRSRWLTCAAVGLVALAVRLAYLWELRDAEALSIVIGDSRAYHEWALRIAAGDWVGTATFFQAPLYPYFLAILYAIFGPSLLAVRLVQVVLGSIACAFLAGAAAHLLDRRRALAAGLVLALYPLAVFYDVLLSKSVLDLFLVTALLLVLARSLRRRRPGLWVWAGAVLALLGLSRENALALVPAVGAWILFGRGARGWRPRWTGLALFAAGLALVLGPVVVRNAVVGGDLALTTSQLGYNLYLGNNPAANGMFQPVVPGHGDAVYEAADARRLAEQATGRRLSASEVSSYWVGRTLDIVRSDPGAWIGVTGRKLAMLLNAVEIGDVDMPAAYAEWSHLLRALMATLHFGVLLPIAGAGLVLSWRFWMRRWIFPLLLAVYAVSIAAFVVYGRYRLPVVPFLALFAVAGLPRLGVLIRRRRWGRVAAAAGVAALLAVASHWPLFVDPRLDQIVMMESNLGVGLGMDPARRESALAHFRRAIELAPDYVEPRKRMALLLLEMGRPDEAVVQLQAVLRLETGDPDTYVGLGRAAAALRRWPEAIAWYGKALELDPGRADVELRMGHALASLERLPEALGHYSRAARLAPGSAEAHFYSGWALSRTGALAEAEIELKRSIEAAPSIPDAYRLLADVYREQGRDAESRRYAEMAARLAARSRSATGAR